MPVTYIFRIGFLALLFFSLTACIGRSPYGHWNMDATSRQGKLPWINFQWVGDSFANRYVPIAAIFVPVIVEDCKDSFACQFDVGSDLTVLYGNSVAGLSGHSARIKERWHESGNEKNEDYLKDITIKIDGIPFYSPQVYVMRHYGDSLSNTGPEPAKIGSIGVDVCQNKVLIMDFPHKRLCIADSIPSEFHTRLTDMTLDRSGRPVFDMSFGGKDYKVAYDCGSSMFPLLVKQSLISVFSTLPNNDSIVVNEWGRKVRIIGRPVHDSFTLAGHRFGNTAVYTSEKRGEENLPSGCDALTGNILFLDKVLILDFRNKKVGML